MPGISKAHVSQLFDQELATCSRLMQLLVDENNAIIDRDILSFEKIVGEKRLVLERMIEHEKERFHLLESNGIRPGLESMNDCLELIHDDGRLSALWQQILEMAADCRDRNRKNHMLVGLCSSHTRKALCILRGEPMTQSMYGPDGETCDTHENISLAIA